MSYHGPKVRLTRSLGVPVGQTEKHLAPRKSRRPGQHPYTRHRKSLYGQQLIEKQRLRHYYNVSDTQLRRYMRNAHRTPGDAKKNLQQTLETRLDNVIRRLHWASSVWQARQMVSHGHFFIDGRKVDLPSYHVSAGDTITVRPRSREFVKRAALEAAGVGLRTPDWLSVDHENLSARVLRLPTPDDLGIPFDIDYTKVIEFYTR